MDAITASGCAHVYRPSQANLFRRWMRIWSAKNLRRTVIVLGTNFFLHGTGNAFAARYSTIFYKSLGIINPFARSCIQSSAVLVVSVATPFLVDWVGRRPLLISGSFVQLSGLLIMGELGMLPRTYESSAGIITFKMLFVLSYTAAWGQLSHTITAELPSAEVRALTYATGSMLAVGAQAAVTFSLPHLLNALSARVGFIFGGITVLAFVFAILCVPESTGKSLEEIDVLFNNNVGVRQFEDARVIFEESEKGARTTARITLGSGEEITELLQARSAA